MKVIHAKFEKDAKLTVDKLVMPVVKNNFSFSTATKKHETHSESIDFTVDKNSCKEDQNKDKKEKKSILFFL